MGQGIRQRLRAWSNLPLTIICPMNVILKESAPFTLICTQTFLNVDTEEFFLTSFILLSAHFYGSPIHTGSANKFSVDHGPKVAWHVIDIF